MGARTILVIVNFSGFSWGVVHDHEPVQTVLPPALTALL